MSVPVPPSHSSTRCERRSRKVGRAVTGCPGLHGRATVGRCGRAIARRMAEGALILAQHAIFVGSARGHVITDNSGMRSLGSPSTPHPRPGDLNTVRSLLPGGVSRDIERGTRGISFLLQFMIFNILPTLVEIGLVAGYLFWHYDWRFGAVTVATLAVYIAFTLFVTEWRMVFRRTMNDMDSNANTRAIDSLLNFETVKTFGNEDWEAQRYDDSLTRWETAAVRNQTSLAALNAGQAFIIGAGVTALMALAADGVVTGRMSLGDLVLVNAFLLQLYLPLNFLGFVYREIKNALADMERMFDLLRQHPDVADAPAAPPLQVAGARIEFDRVSFAYDPRRPVLHEVSFVIEPGQKVAVVGTSGSGKTTLSRLLFRFYDVGDGIIRIDGQDIRQVT
ncbi:MAG: ABC transporter ATP-binding protein/permease, partial [Betaproteobacteria bacterium]|nr:ABC transporter ATP-binding protein/permease [Betaproteobacteria bacterium]